jgi:hypothetical protein
MGGVAELAQERWTSLVAMEKKGFKWEESRLFFDFLGFRNRGYASSEIARSNGTRLST